MPLSRKLALDPEQLEEILASSWNCRIATIGPGTRINLTPMWFGWAGGRIYIYGRARKSSMYVATRPVQSSLIATRSFPNCRPS